MGKSKWKAEESPALSRNPNLSKGQAQKCDAGIHEYALFSVSGQRTMACRHCGARKGKLPPVTQVSNREPLMSGKSEAKGSLSQKPKKDVKGKKANK